MTVDERTELETYRALLGRMQVALQAVGEGDLEARVLGVPEMADDPDLVQLCHHLNRVLDLVDAFSREAAATLSAAAEGRYHRRVLEQGLPGQFGASAAAINAGQESMAQAAQRLQEARDERRDLAEQFETVVVGLSNQVVDSSRELAGTTGRLNASAGEADGRMEQARTTIASLEDSSRAIHQVVRTIDEIAAQTRLLALNAAIEAARVGEAGKGFAVVAKEIKELANQTRTATQEVGATVTGIQEATLEAVSVMEDVRGTVHAMNDMVGEMDGRVGSGLVPTTLRLRQEAGDLLQALRS